MAGRDARRKSRILKSTEYQFYQAHGKRQHSRHFCLLAYFSHGKDPRYGMAVSRKIGNAVSRNRVKRLLREFFRLHIAELPGWQIVAIAKKDADLLKLADVAAELAPLLRRLGAALNA